MGIIAGLTTMLKRRAGKASAGDEGNSAGFTHAEIQEIVSAYGNAMVAQAAKRSIVSDVSELPYPKARIKKALIFAIAMTQDMKSRELLKDGYVSLADWQEGVGPNPFNFTQVDTDNRMQVAQRIVSEGPAYMKLNSQSIAERIALLEELKTLAL